MLHGRSFVLKASKGFESPLMKSKLSPVLRKLGKARRRQMVLVKAEGETFLPEASKGPQEDAEGRSLLPRSDLPYYGH